MMARLMDDGQTDRKTDEKYASVKKDMFPAKHILFKVPHHVPIYLHRLLQVESAYCKTHVENILQNYSSCTFTS